MDNDRLLTIKEASEYTGFSENTVRSHIIKWGGFKMTGSRLWRIKKSDLDRLSKNANNIDRLALSVDKEYLCRSTKEKTAKHGGLTYKTQTEKELDALLARL